MLYSRAMGKTVQEIANVINGSIIGNGQTVIEGITNAETPLDGHIAFAQDEKTFRRLENSSLSCLIVPESIKESSKILIQTKNPKLAWAQLLPFFYPEALPCEGISPQAFVSSSAVLGKHVTIEPFCFIDEGVEIGDNCVVHSHVSLGKKVKLGQHCQIYPHTTVYRECILGDRVIIHAGSAVGADGFGYVATEKGHQKVPQVGNVVIENDVEIGALVTIDRATIGSTRIGTGCKIDNLVQIGHNVQLGAHTVISAQTGISGSTRVGNFVTMGGKVGVGDHCEIGDFVMIGAGAGLPTGKKIPAKQIIFGAPARPYQEARKQIAAQLRSAEMYDEIKLLRKKVEELELKQRPVV